MNEKGNIFFSFGLS